MKQRSVMKHQFSQVPSATIPRSSFNRSHGVKTTFDGGWLVPIFLDEALPGDTFNLSMTGFARLATPIHPIMDNMFMETFFFAVPNRLLWDNWQKFCGEQDDPGDSIDFTIPSPSSVTTFNVTTGNALWDYMGLPWVASFDLSQISAFPFRAYTLIWNEWFRDQNLQDSLVYVTDNGPDDTATYGLKRRGKRHDYFTSCLPWPQKAPDGAVDFPLGTTAPILGLGIDDAFNVPTINQGVTETGGGATTYVEGLAVANLTNQFVVEGRTSDDSPLIFADLTNATAATINDLRQAFQIQKLQERDARGGTRYTEIIRSHFGVTSPDARLQRPEFLGGGSSPVQINQVPQTSETSTTAQGTLAAYGTATLSGHGFTKSFTEHCTLIGLVSVRADLTYQQGLDRMWSRATRYDYYWPALAQIGEQSVLNKELWFTSGDTGTINDAVFGYQERYAEYRYKPSKITGLFRSDNAATLDPWHLSQDFATLPVLDDTFIQDTPPIDRAIAVPAEPHFLFDAYFSLKCARPMPLYGVPGQIDHF